MNSDPSRGNRAVGCLVMVLGSIVLWGVIVLIVGALFGWWKL